jgi:hypothetical protein
VLVEHIGSSKDLHDCLVLFSARARNSLDSELLRSGDVDAVQQISQSWRCSKECSLYHLHLQPCCPLLLPSHCFLPPYDRYHGDCSMAVVALLPVLPEVLVSPVPRPQSRMVPPPEESRAVAPAEVAHPLVLVV